MDRAKYTSCVGSGMKGKSLTREERQMEFCIVSKLCSGKAKGRDEAKVICSQPKPPKPVKIRETRPQTCEQDVLKLAHCAAEHIDMNLASNINSVEMAIANALMECRCQN